MEAGAMEEALRVVDLCLSRIKWRLSSSARHRLHIDVIALCTRLRPVVMVDYGGKIPELTEHLCKLLHLCHEESSILQSLRVMIIEDMIYLTHVKGLAEHSAFDPTFQTQPFFVDLDQDPPMLLPFTEQNILISGLMAIQKLFSCVFPVDGTNKHLSMAVPSLLTTTAETSTNDRNESSSFREPISLQSMPVDLSSCMKDTDVVIPTLNGWLLGYPVVYLFSKDHIADAVYNLSTKSLRIYKIIAHRKGASGRKQHEEELMSFSVPYDLSMAGSQEVWAQAFLARLMGKLESCSHVWSSLRLEVSVCYSQAIVL
ncbi:unnamed protein product [Spirodela intermedia]|uniref:Uncharacterized protein n=1 Tax=Spirodela intermedia TaxID=51605 RepID=A0A7I8JEV1_SPIIN|nr:unnamed protein product [Spirodela intermedia]CAA6668285.1 unnamed protein product [Spirodela intermedia]